MPRLIPDTGPQRVLASSNLVYTVGSGLYLTAGVLYFTQAVHLPAGRVGLGLGIAGGVALALGVAVGHLADRCGARGVYIATLLIQALSTAAFVLADSFWPFVLAVCAATGAKAAGTAARSPLIRHHGGKRPQEFRAYLRAVTNVGVSLGALVAGWVVQVGTLTAYQLMVVGNALAFLVAAALLSLLPPVAPVAEPLDGPRRSALRDRPYLLLTAVDGVMAIQFKVLTVAIPLWLVGATEAPHWLISGTMLTGTVMVVALQVRAAAASTPRQRAVVPTAGPGWRSSSPARWSRWPQGCRDGPPRPCSSPPWSSTRSANCGTPRPGSKCPSPSHRPTPPASTWGSSAWVRASPRPSARVSSSRSASPGAAPAGTSWDCCSR